jgi:hypothetical protein
MFAGMRDRDRPFSFGTVDNGGEERPGVPAPIERLLGQPGNDGRITVKASGYVIIRSVASGAQPIVSALPKIH